VSGQFRDRKKYSSQQKEDKGAVSFRAIEAQVIEELCFHIG
jgi:hypothetical protein